MAIFSQMKICFVHSLDSTFSPKYNKFHTNCFYRCLIKTFLCFTHILIGGIGVGFEQKLLWSQSVCCAEKYLWKFCVKRWWPAALTLHDKEKSVICCGVVASKRGHPYLKWLLYSVLHKHRHGTLIRLAAKLSAVMAWQLVYACVVTCCKIDLAYLIHLL